MHMINKYSKLHASTPTKGTDSKDFADLEYRTSSNDTIHSDLKPDISNKYRLVI
jgi:hypothetical protein